MSQKFSSSELVIEGEVIAQSAHSDTRYGIVTKNLILVHSLLESDLDNAFESTEISDTLSVYTFGGEILDEGLLYVHDLHLSLGDIGLFYLDADHEVEQEDALESFVVFSGQQGFYKYRPSKNQTLISPFWTDGNQEDLFNEIKANTDGGIDKESFLVAEGHWVVIPEIASIGLEFSEIDLFLEDRYADLISIKSMSLGFTFADSDKGSNVVSSRKLQVKNGFGLLANGYEGGFSQVSSTHVSIDLDAGLDDVIQIPAGGLVARIQVDNDLLGLFNDGELEISTTLSSGQTVDGEDTVMDVENVEVIKIKTDANFNCEDGEVSVEPFRNGAGVRSQLAQRCSNRENGGIVTITGCNFGDIDPDDFCDLLPGGSNGYRVEFSKFGTGTGTVTPLCTDYISWTDEEIQVYVPSIGYNVTYFLGIPSVTSSPSYSDFAVSGPVTVYTPGSNPGLVGEVEIPFTALNAISSINGVRYAVRHQLHDGSLTAQPSTIVQGYKLYFSTSYDDNLPRAPFERALAHWKSNSSVNFETISLNDSPLYSRACEIDFGPITSGNLGDAILGYTPPDAYICSTPNNESENFIKSFKIIFSNILPWWTAVSLPQSGAPDLESVALHELGHAIQLGHVEDSESVMYPTQSLSSVKRVLDQGSKDGGIHLVFASLRDQVCTPTHTPLQHTCGTSGVDNSTSDQSSSIAVSPNPTDGTVIIYSGEMRIGDEIEIYNLLGQVKVRKKVNSQGAIILDCLQLEPGQYFVGLMRKGEAVFKSSKLVVR